MGHEEWEHGPRTDADDLLGITRRRHSTAVVIFATGEIDIATAEHLATALRDELDNRPGTLVIDLTGVAFMGSIGMAVLAEADQAASASGQRLRVVVCERQAAFRSMTISGLSDRLSMFCDLDDAIATR
jgi:anti-sigma B factor antagonist